MSLLQQLRGQSLQEQLQTRSAKGPSLVQGRIQERTSKGRFQNNTKQGQFSTSGSRCIQGEDLSGQSQARLSQGRIQTRYLPQCSRPHCSARRSLERTQSEPHHRRNLVFSRPGSVPGRVPTDRNPSYWNQVYSSDRCTPRRNLPGNTTSTSYRHQAQSSPQRIPVLITNRRNYRYFQSIPATGDCLRQRHCCPTWGQSRVSQPIKVTVCMFTINIPM